MAHDAKLLSRPWGFDLTEVRHPNLHVWHRSLDRNVSIDTGRAVAAAIPGACAHFFENEAHISVAMNQAVEVLGVTWRGRG